MTKVSPFITMVTVIVQLATSSCIFSLERNISNFCDEKRDDRHVLVAEYSRMPARLSLVQLIGRDVIAAVTCETSLQKQRLGAVVVVVSRRKTRLVKKNKRREKTVQSRFKKILKNHVIYLGPALESRLEHGRLDCGTYVLAWIYFWYKCDRKY